MSDRHDRLLEHLSQADGWLTAAELAGRLGVTTRSVRSYVTAVKSMAAPLEVIESSTEGYRLDRESYAAFLAQASGREASPDTPQERMYHLTRRLADAPEGLDVHDLSDSLFVSESTIEADLRKVKTLAEECRLSLVRHGSTVTLAGGEYDLRRMLSRIFRDENAQRFVRLSSIQEEFTSVDLGAFKTDLMAMLDENGYFVNEYGVDNVLLHVAIAVDRAAIAPSGPGRPRAEVPPRVVEISGQLEALIRRHFAVELSGADLDYLAMLLTTRVVTPGHGAPVQTVVDEYVTPEHLGEVRRIVKRVNEEYLVDLDDEDFMVRLSLHVANLIARARDDSFSRNPMTRSIKTGFPMIYELAVFIASELQGYAHIDVNDDEIAYIALHVGSYLERQARRRERVTCAIVCPNYYDMHVDLRRRIEESLGDELQVEIVITRTDVEWAQLAADLVVTTLPGAPMSDRVVVIQPFLTQADVEALRRAAARVRRIRHRARIKEQLLQFFDPSLFLRNFHAEDDAAMIRALGERMRVAGIVDDAYIESAVAREALSSTAFTDDLAVPHSMTMTASRTAIAIVVNEQPMPWGENRVHVIALIAFSASGRSAFQAVFDQFVDVFSDRDVVRRIIARAVDFPTFIEELVRGIDS
ncbi:PTS sugar transporter subunit IIA [Microbacterium sp. STN6]|uniref:BglG family transcription antiterminator n=1 Tax=Microbacterium sp. STN6 TaxID=2995588 RepID=UPI002260C171|nr:PTS sugar transporter subunit IIA [Microbacterium sp. STN6]MCX7523230.1 PTS sugar transporter subunit IIA [Microbacterium sp. STN6]